jgi:hypothetical protein
LRIRGSNQSPGRQAVRVLFAFDYEDAAPGFRSDQFREPVQDAPDAFQIPNPTAFSIGPPLGESLRRIADRLIKKRSAFIWVVIGCFDPLPTPARPRRGKDRRGRVSIIAKQVFDADPQGMTNASGSASAEAFQKNLSIRAKGNR